MLFRTLNLSISGQTTNEDIIVGIKVHKNWSMLEISSRCNNRAKQYQIKFLILLRARWSLTWDNKKSSLCLWPKVNYWGRKCKWIRSLCDEIRSNNTLVIVFAFGDNGGSTAWVRGALARIRSWLVENGILLLLKGTSKRWYILPVDCRT